MNKKHLSAAVASHLVVLMASTGLASAADLMVQPQSEVTTNVGLGVGAGIGVGFMVFDLPELDTGVDTFGQGSFDRETEVNAFGPVISGAIGGQIPDTIFSIELVGSYATATGDDRAVNTFGGGVSGFYIAGPTTLGAGATTLTRGPGPLTQASSTSSVGIANSAQASASGFGGQANQLGFSALPGGGGAYTGVGTNGTSGQSIALGGVGSNAGYGFGAFGNLGGLSLVTTQDEDVKQGNVELRVGATAKISDGASILFTAAPVYRNINRDITTTTRPTAVPGTLAFDTIPGFLDVRNEELDADYYGGLLGATMTVALNNYVTFNFGGDIGYAYMDADYSGRSELTIPVAAGAPLFSVSNGINGQSIDDDTYFARARAAFSYNEGPWSLGIGAQADYLADVPTLKRASSGNFAINNPGNATITSGAQRDRFELTTEDMWAYGVTASVAYRF